jgi:hypothetical protein
MSGVGSSYVAAEFTVVETGVSENAPIILGHPFLATIKAVIYTDTVKIIFIINGKKEIFSFKNNILRTPAHPRYPYRQEYKLTVEKKRRDRRRKKEQSPSTTRGESLDDQYNSRGESLDDQYNSIRKQEPISFTTAAKVRRRWSPINPLLHQSMKLPTSCLRHGIGHQLNV